MVLALPGCLDHLLDDVRRCRLVRIPHAEIDDIFTALPSVKLERLHLREDIRRKSLDSIKPVTQPHDPPLTFSVMLNVFSWSLHQRAAERGLF
jgi:hypothetical protein